MGTLPIAERRRRFVVVVDNTPECHVAIHFAALRAAHVEGGQLVFFHVVPPAEFQHWMAVEDRMREESIEEAHEALAREARDVREIVDLEPEMIVRSGNVKDELQTFIEEEDDIFALFLGANAEGDPGPLVQYFCGNLSGSLKCPVVIIPGGLTDEQVQAMA